MANKTPQARPPSRHRLPKAYLVVWAILATLSGSYLAAALAAPDMLGLDTTPAMHGTAQMAANGSTSNGNVRQLQERLSRAQLEIAKLRTQVSRQEEQLAQSRAAQRTVAAAAPEQSADPALPQVRPVATTAILNGADTPDAPRETLRPPANEAAVAAAQIVNAQQNPSAQQPASPIQTGSIAIPPTPTRAPPPPLTTTQVTTTTQPVEPAPTTTLSVPGTPVTPPATVTARATQPKVGVRLATGPSIDALRLRWSTILDQAGATLSGLQPHFIASNQPGALGPTYDLIAGPLETLSDAQRICNAAAVRSSVCEIRKLEKSGKL